MSENRGDPASAQAKWLEYFKVPGVDTKALLESQRRNIEALTRATEVATDGAAAVYRRQQEIMQAAGEQVSVMMRDNQARQRAAGGGREEGVRAGAGERP